MTKKNDNDKSLNCNSYCVPSVKKIPLSNGQWAELSTEHWVKNLYGILVSTSIAPLPNEFFWFDAIRQYDIHWNRKKFTHLKCIRWNLQEKIVFEWIIRTGYRQLSKIHLTNFCVWWFAAIHCSMELIIFIRQKLMPFTFEEIKDCCHSFLSSNDNFVTQLKMCGK